MVDLKITDIKLSTEVSDLIILSIINSLKEEEKKEMYILLNNTLTTVLNQELKIFLAKKSNDQNIEELCSRLQSDLQNSNPEYSLNIIGNILKELGIISSDLELQELYVNVLFAFNTILVELIHTNKELLPNAQNIENEIANHINCVNK